MEETRALISLWGQADVESQLDGMTSNCRIYEQIDLDNLGWDRTWKQCRTKMKNLAQRYRKVRALKAYRDDYSGQSLINGFRLRMQTGLVGMVLQPILFTMNLMTSWVLGLHLLQQFCLRVQVMAVWCSHYKRTYKGTALNVMV